MRKYKRDKKFFDFAVKDIKPRATKVLFAPATIIVGQFAALDNHLRREIAPLLAGLLAIVVFMAGATLGISLFGHSPILSEDCFSATPKCSTLSANHKFGGWIPHLWELLTNEVAWLLLLLGYVIVRLAQHVWDWRDRHTPWAHAELDRFFWWFGRRPPEKDFPCLIVGRGGSGKSTLAQIMENEFLRRKLFKPPNFQDLGREDELVARSSARVGEDVKEYRVSWRPDIYKVGRLAEAYDMPGQITDDWAKAIEEVGDCTRVAIFNVVTYGCNNYIRKFERIPKKNICKLREDKNAACNDLRESENEDWIELCKRLVEQGKYVSCGE